MARPVRFLDALTLLRQRELETLISRHGVQECNLLFLKLALQGWVGKEQMSANLCGAGHGFYPVRFHVGGMVEQGTLGRVRLIELQRRPGNLLGTGPGFWIVWCVTLAIAPPGKLASMAVFSALFDDLANRVGEGRMTHPVQRHGRYGMLTLNRFGPCFPVNIQGKTLVILPLVRRHGVESTGTGKGLTGKQPYRQ